MERLTHVQENIRPCSRNSSTGEYEYIQERLWVLKELVRTLRQTLKSILKMKKKWICLPGIMATRTMKHCKS